MVYTGKLVAFVSDLSGWGAAQSLMSFFSITCGLDPCRAWGRALDLVEPWLGAEVTPSPPLLQACLALTLRGRGFLEQRYAFDQLPGGPATFSSIEY
jgi:hypothetical protein